MTRVWVTLGTLAWLLTLAMACQTPQWPVGGPLTSGFGIRMEGATPGLHRGVDLVAPAGTPIRPLLSGRVRFAGTMRGFGKVVWIDHSESLLSLYAHLSEIRVTTGQSIEKHDVLGLSGQSGNAQGAHLHMEIWRWGWEVDPVTFMGGPPPAP